MSDSENPPSTEPQPQPQIPETKPEPPVERAGEILRRERVAKRIAIETIARDLKLNPKFIKAIEAVDYQALPGDPYIRVYIRSIARYLMLDPNEILKLHFREQGITLDESKENRITISMEKIDKPKIPWTVVATLAGILVVIIIIASRMNTDSPAPQATPAAAPDTVQKPAADTTALDSAQAEQFRPDSAAALAANGTTPAAAGTVPKPDSAKAVKRDSLVLRVEALRDSVWIQAYQDGKSWRGTLHPGNSRRLTALDSLNVRVGRNSQLRYTLNGKALENRTLESTRGADIVAFRIDHAGVTPWTTPKWISVFKQ